MTNFITDQVRALIGTAGPAINAPEPVERSSIRRFAQAIMDDNPLYWDEAYARKSRYGRIMAPPLYPLHAVRRAGGTPDPLRRAMVEPDYDGAGDVLGRLGLPSIPVPQVRLLNGGNDVELYSLAGLGDLIVAVSSFDDIYQKDGRSGSLIFAIVQTRYWDSATNRRLLRGRQTLIWR